MRQAQKGKRGKPRKKTEPLAEGIRKKRRPKGFFTKMSDEELVEYAKGVVSERGLVFRKELEKTDGGLYGALIKRKLLDRIGLVYRRRKVRDWASMSDEKLISFTKIFLEQKKITSRKELGDADAGLYTALWRRGLLDRLGLESSHSRERRDWTLMSDEDLISLARKSIEKEKITGRSELVKVDRGLYRTLRKRKLLDAVGLESRNADHRDWASMSDEKLVEYAKNVIDRENITGRSELEGADTGLYVTLKKRKLIDAVGLENKRSDDRDWVSMSDEDIISLAEQALKANSIGSRKDLQRVDNGLYTVLWRRNLLDAVGFVSKKTDAVYWTGMEDEEIVEYARDFVLHKGITKRAGLKKAYPGLYEAVRSRGLLDGVFAQIESDRDREAVQEVVDAMKDF